MYRSDVKMATTEMLHFNSLVPWQVPKNTPPARGPIEHTFIQMFSLREKFESLISPTGIAMGVDSFSDARQSIACIGRMLDSGISRALISLEDKTESIVVDVITLDGTRIWALPDKYDEPIVFIRYAYHTRDFVNPLNNPVDIGRIESVISETHPDDGMVQLVKSASKEEMAILNKFFQANAANMDKALREMVSAAARKELSKIPLSYVSFVKPLIKSEELPEDHCNVCGRPSKKVCSMCKVAKYCSRDCQKQDWRAGHRKECKLPEQIAKENKDPDDNNNETDDPWIDVNPSLTPESHHGYSSTISHINPCMSKARVKIVDTREMASFPGIKRDSIMIVKVQIVLMSRLEEYKSMLIYPQGKKFEIDAMPANIVSDYDGYRRLWTLIRTRGSDAGLGMGGCKAFFDAYVTSDGLLRIMIDKMKPIQKW